MATTPNLQRKLQQTLGAEAAGDLVAWMQSMDANRNDVSELRREMQVMQVGFARLEGRMDSLQARMETFQERMEKLLERGLRDQTRFFFLAWAVLLAAFVGLYSR
jgi:chromosome segregation ATPase